MPYLCPMLRRLVLALAIGVIVSAAGRADAVDDLVKAELARQRIPGAAFVVVQDGKIARVGAHGLADSEFGRAVTTHTIFRIQSVSKQFTAAGVMLLVEEGKIRLDDPVSRHLDGCPEAWRKITVRHLLGQTSGLFDFVNEPTIDLKHEATEQELMASVASRSLKFEPGEVWDYSNTNYLLLGMIISRVSGRWYGDFLADRIFRPLGMTRTSVPRGRDDTPDYAKGYTLQKGQIRPSGALATAVLSNGGGGVLSTVLDLAKWDAALYTEQILKRATLEQMWRPGTLNNGSPHGHGFGWDIGEIAGHRRLSHEGRWTGFSAQIDRFVDDRLTVIVLTNLAESAPARISRAIAGTFISALAAPVYAPIPDKEPEVTSRFFDVLRRTRDGSLRAEDFTEPVWAYIATQSEQLKQTFTSFGPIQKLTLVERSEKDGERSYRYRARFSRTSMIFHFVLTKENRISVMMPEQVNQ